MNQLATDGILPSWHYTDDAKARLVALPARGWLAGWLACVVEIPAPHDALPVPGDAR